MLPRVGLERRGVKSLRMLNQAGGRLRDDVKMKLAVLCRDMGVEFFVMYGQTEAAPRISYVPPSRLTDKIGSIGIAIPGGTLEIDPDNDELIYRGPNVMMGYAEDRADLMRGDACRGVLRTGDIGRRDAEGFFYLTGRMKRFVKLSGARFNLDDIEATLNQAYETPLACVGADDRLDVVLSGDVSVDERDVKAFLRERFDIYAGLVRVHRRSALPYNENGKVDYRALAELIPEEP